ncbi:MAG: Type I restriction modification DNA specificity domain protein [Syntrophorhabdus sp. PtaU1.Bin058]|nr:MAG: Type I restriction modification DNA specificity domain protein [Syntrophorhabdus sp. PtaU1.Bin058]
MKQKIKDIADIQIGYQFRGKVETDPQGTHKVIQIRDFDEQFSLNKENLQTVRLKGDADRYLVNKNDVLFLSRGHRNYAIPITVQLNDTVAASYFFILKIRTNKILPDYLAWYINQAPAQEYLYNIARRGTHMPLVPLSAFTGLEIEIPDIKSQSMIVSLSALLDKEKVLLNKLREKRSQLIKTICLKIARQRSDQDE